MGALRELDTCRFALFVGVALVAGVSAAYAPGAVIALGAVVALWVGSRRAPLGTIAALILLLLPFTIALNPWPGVDLAVSRVAIALAAVLVVWRYHDWRWAGQSAIIVILAAFLGWAVLSVLWAEGSVAWALRKAAVWWTLWPFAFVVAAAGAGESARERFARAIGIAGVGAAAAGLAFWVAMASGALRIAAWRDAILPIFAGATVAETAGQFSSWYVNIGGATIVRALGVFPDPHTIGAVLVLALPFAVFAWRGADNARARGCWFAGIAVIVAALFLTFSRSAYLGLIAGAVVFAIVRTELRRAVPVAAMALGVAVFVLTPVGARLLDAFRLDEGSNAGRLALWRTGGAVAFTHPLGVGVGNAPLVAPANDLPAGTALTERTPASFHNTYIDVAAELGVIGIVLWLALFGVAIVACWRSARASPAAAAMLASLVGFAMVSMFDIMVYSPVVAPLTAAVLGLAAGAKTRSAKSKMFTPSAVEGQNDGVR